MSVSPCWPSKGNALQGESKLLAVLAYTWAEAEGLAIGLHRQRFLIAGSLPSSTGS